MLFSLYLGAGIWFAFLPYEKLMDENPYKSPEQGEASETGAPEQRALTTPIGCVLAIATGLILGFLLLWVIGFARS